MQLYIYKRGHGYYTRLWTAIACLFLAALGCYRLHSRLILVDNPWVQHITPALLWVALAWLVYWASNRPSLADFFIAAEGELKKVSWSNRQQVVVSTVIVVFVVALMSILLGSIDVIFRLFFDLVIGLYS